MNDGILPELGKAQDFSNTDLKDGFLRIQLDEKSSRLTTLQIPWGRHHWIRMPNGISPAPEYFQQKFDQNLQGLPGIYRITDDLLTEIKVIVRLFESRERNMKFNKAKFDFKC